jgi:microcystin-dependent protein
MAQDPILGCVYIFAGNFAPRGYSLCQGQLISISQNPALFSLLGTTYGGDGQQTFGLPNLTGRGPVEWGQGTGLSDVAIGQLSGAQQVTLTTNNMPSHTHLVNCDSNGAGNDDPTNGFPGNAGFQQTPTIYSSGPANATMSPSGTTPAGSNFPIPVLNPYLGMNYIIATEGIFPSRN